jgi:3-methyladenine DNA glycosylase AlkD
MLPFLTDLHHLFDNIDRLADQQDFLVRKAIGWSLREFARTDPVAVADFVSTRSLSPLSKREALRGVVRAQS